MNTRQLERMRNDNGFIAALDQSGGSTPNALAKYGILQDSYSNEDEMFQLVHAMRSRIMESTFFTKERILAAILFEKTMDSKVQGKYTPDYLWEEKGILPILKVDKGLDHIENGVHLMKPMVSLDDLLIRANNRHIFGTKMRSVIKEANKEGIEAIVKQQFEVGKKIASYGLVPILEPEVDIHTPNKQSAEKLLKKEIINHMSELESDEFIMFKLTLPEVDDFYSDIIKHPNVVRTVALSGGYSQEEANQRLIRNHHMIASFSRALAEGLNANQSDEAFDKMLDKSIESIYKASLT
ncbi:MAG: fructose bisphosphate aldolase [Peptostreptococcaceae bacterium]|nr:fructose bisphosphate aldolase [Peptostreptococcaceae bacterium]